MLKKDFKFLNDIKISGRRRPETKITLQDTLKKLYIFIQSPTFAYMKCIGKTTLTDFSYEYSYEKFIEFINSVHGTQQTFEFLEDGNVEVFRKKTGDSLGITHLNPSQTLPIFIETSKTLTPLKNKQTLINLLSTFKRYQCKLDYFTGFNEPSLFLGDRLYIFGTDGIHSSQIVLADTYGSNSQYCSYHISMDNLKILEVFLANTDKAFDFNIEDETLKIYSNHDYLKLSLQPNDDIEGLKDLYQDFGKNVLTVLNKEKREEILSFFSRSYLSQYRKDNDIKESLTMYVDIDNTGISLRDQKVINWSDLKEFHMNKRICLYHLIEYLKGNENDILLYSDRIEDADSLSILIY